MKKLAFALMASAAIPFGALAQQQTPPAPPEAPGQNQMPQQQQPQTPPGTPPGQMDEKSPTQRPISPRALNRQQVQEVQQALSSKGMQVQPDGVWGPQTDAALRNFQQQQGIQATGQLDQRTQAALGVTLSPTTGQQPPGVSPGAPPSQQPPAARPPASPRY